MEYAEFNDGVYFFCLRQETSSLGKLDPKSQNRQFKLKFGTETNLNMPSPLVVFTFSVLQRKHPFWDNLVQKIKIVNLSWNCMPRIIWISRYQWWCFRQVTPFLDEIGLKNLSCQFNLKFGTKTISNMQRSMVVFAFSVWEGKHPFSANLVKKFKFINLSWNLVPILIWISRIQWSCSVFLFFLFLDGKKPFWQIWFKKPKL